MENLLVDLARPSRELHQLIDDLLEFNLKAFTVDNAVPIGDASGEVPGLDKNGETAYYVDGGQWIERYTSEEVTRT